MHYNIKFSVLLLSCVLVAGCSDPEEEAAELINRDDGTLACALAGAEDFTRNCDVERVSNDDGNQMIFRHPDGGFRRFDVVTDGRALVSADGADEAKVTIVEDGLIEVQVEDDRYQLPARVADTATDTNAS
ncbi:hypothetical protein [Alterisphingorhabdus coralli]|uniref:Lipoprotein n=1 Tax=Alterisphingorhabdus coralli TaxID=3071408 RepID=A0AA97I0P3_9SPHN|nr:hypothetical protein [Parasphingorhabdus sp. SCSIO 66989]WOE73970.1 hypothetical protein RB602_08840 [Parasphingorhabdus sp. SCSIO 66989]